MPLDSDLRLNVTKFEPQRISQQTSSFNEQLMRVMAQGPRWWEVGAPKYRQMRWNGETPMPRPAVLASAQDITLPSRDPGRQIPCRLFRPADGTVGGLFYHIHGGGWVLQSEHYQDTMLQHWADRAHMIVLSVGYRLAPEHPYPAGNEDCLDVAEHLVDRGKSSFGVPLKFMGGDSAGGHLSVLTCFHLLSSRPNFAFHGLILNFGAYDLSGFLPQTWNFRKAEPLILDVEIMQHFIAAYLPGKSVEQRRDWRISPFFADLKSMKLPPALFTCGSEDCLLDDSVMMCARWMASGASAVLKVYPGAPHGFVGFPSSGTEQTQRAWDDIVSFLSE